VPGLGHVPGLVLLVRSDVDELDLAGGHELGDALGRQLLHGAENSRGPDAIASAAPAS
jgi:hypothetical protein